MYLSAFEFGNELQSHIDALYGIIPNTGINSNLKLIGNDDFNSKNGNKVRIMIVQLLRIITTGFWFDIKEKEGKKQIYTTVALMTAKKRFMRNGINIDIILQCVSKAHYTIVINGKIKNIIC